MRSRTVAGAEFEAGADFPHLRGRKVALAANHTALCRGRHLAEVLAESLGVQLVALLAPEHGFWGKEAAEFPSGVHPELGVPVHSLYGEALKPTPEMLGGAHLLVYDMQSIGVRYYTYETTMRYCLQAAAEAGLPFVVFDRPNPLGGEVVEGPVLEAGHESFVGALPVPVRHGMTIGELALLARDWLGLNTEVRVVRMQGWRRAMDYEATGLPWVPPSPAMLTLSTARVYPGTCLLEGTNLSEGRGTEAPFEVVGAPFISGAAVAARLQQAGLPGVKWEPVDFVPRRSKWAGEHCGGVRLVVEDPQAFRPVAAGIHLLRGLRDLAGDSFQWEAEHFGHLIGNAWVRRWIEDGRTAYDIVTAWQAGLAEFLEQRQRYLCYS